MNFNPFFCSLFAPVHAKDFTAIFLDFMHSFIAYQPRTEIVRSGAIKVSRLAFCLLNQSCFDQSSGDYIQKRWLYERPFNLHQCWKWLVC